MNTETIDINPTQPPIGTVIWLHGLGADGNDFVSLVPEFDLPLRFVFPNAPMRAVTFNHGYVMRAWFDIHSLDREAFVDKKGIFESVQLVETLIEREIKLGIPANKIVLAGFSQGSVIALATGITCTKRLAGIIGLSGYLPGANAIFAKATEINRSIPIFLAHGTQDQIISYQYALSIYSQLQNEKYNVEWHSYEMQHTVCTEEISDIKKWLMKNLM